MKTPEQRQWRHSAVSIVNFEHVSLFTVISIVDFEQVSISLEFQGHRKEKPP